MPSNFKDSKLDQASSQNRVTTIHASTTHRFGHHDQNGNFILTGFHQADGIRHFLYQRHHNDGSASEFTVSADLKLLRKHGIALQELPLLCRNLLEKQDPGSELTAISFTEDLMKEQAHDRAALKQAAEARRKSYRRVSRPSYLGQDRR